MTLSRRIEDVDEGGRRSVTMMEEPLGARTTSNDETVAEAQVVRSDGWNMARGFVPAFGLWILAVISVSRVQPPTGDIGESE